MEPVRCNTDAGAAGRASQLDAPGLWPGCSVWWVGGENVMSTRCMNYFFSRIYQTVQRINFWCTRLIEASNICRYLSPNLWVAHWHVSFWTILGKHVFFSKPEAIFPYLSKPFLYKGLIKSLKPTVALVGVSCALVTALSWECECVTCGWRSMSPAVYTAFWVQPLRVRDTLTSAVTPVTQEDMLFFDSGLQSAPLMTRQKAHIYWKVTDEKRWSGRY